MPSLQPILRFMTSQPQTLKSSYGEQNTRSDEKRSRRATSSLHNRGWILNQQSRATQHPQVRSIRVATGGKTHRLPRCSKNLFHSTGDKDLDHRFVLKSRTPRRGSIRFSTSLRSYQTSVKYHSRGTPHSSLQS